MEINRTGAESMHMNAEQTSFLMPMGTMLNPENRWVRLARLVPWELAEETYNKHFENRQGGPTPLPARVALGALIIKERLGLTDRETVEQIRENPYLQYFLGRSSFTDVPLFDHTMLAHFKHRLGFDCVQAINNHIVESTLSADAKADGEDEDDNDQANDSGPGDGQQRQLEDVECADVDDADPEKGPLPTHCQGALLIDATCAPADITYPTDLKLLNRARELCEQVIDVLHQPYVGERRKPRTYRKNARRDFLNATKAKRLSRRKMRTAIGKQLRYLERDLRILQTLVHESPTCLRSLSPERYRKLLVSSAIYRQQLAMYLSGDHRIDDRIVSISQPHVRPIVRGKAHANTEFGAKISASTYGGMATLDRLSWDAYHEGADLPAQAEAFRARTGSYPTVIHADKAYRTRANRTWCNARGIRLAGLPPGRPPVDPAAIRARRRQVREDEAARQPIEGVFGRAKRRFSLDRIMAKNATTSAVTIALIFVVMNLEAALRFLCALFIVVAGSVIACIRGIWQICGPDSRTTHHPPHTIGLALDIDGLRPVR